MMRFSGPTSVCQKAASGDNLVRAGNAWPKRSSACGTEPGFSRYVRNSTIMGVPPDGGGVETLTHFPPPRKRQASKPWRDRRNCVTDAARARVRLTTTDEI